MNNQQYPDFRPYGYDITKAIGSGHSGLVYAVRSLHEIGDMFVCKLVALESLPAKDRRLAEQEVELLRSLEHKNIVRFHDCFRIETTGTIGMVMEYCEQGDLRHVIKERSKTRQFFPERHVMTWFGQLADGLRYIHAHRVIHRDLKASNIFLQGSFPYKCLIGDFGISRVLDDTMSAAQTVIGTPYYLSPEVCKKEPYSYKSDIWSLGVCLYEMITFKLPFRGSNLLALVTRIIAEPFETANTYNPDCSTALSSLLIKLLTKDPQIRPSAAELMRDQFVRSFLDDRPIAAAKPVPIVAAQPIVVARLVRPRFQPVPQIEQEDHVDAEEVVHNEELVSLKNYVTEEVIADRRILLLPSGSSMPLHTNSPCPPPLP